jgi:hypothetical protein
MPKPRISEDELQVRRNIALSDTLAAKAKEIGGGSISGGIRAALDAYKVKPVKKPRKK